MWCLKVFEKQNENLGFIPWYFNKVNFIRYFMEISIQNCAFSLYTQIIVANVEGWRPFLRYYIYLTHASLWFQAPSCRLHVWLLRLIEMSDGFSCWCYVRIAHCMTADISVLNFDLGQMITICWFINRCLLGFFKFVLGRLIYLGLIDILRTDFFNQIE